MLAMKCGDCHMTKLVTFLFLLNLYYSSTLFVLKSHIYFEKRMEMNDHPKFIAVSHSQPATVASVNGSHSYSTRPQIRSI